MSEQPDQAWPAVVPMPTYEDVGAASIWLCHAFGFKEEQRFTDREGTVNTVILTVPGGGVLLLGGMPGYQGPRRHRENCEAARRWQQLSYIVDGVLVTVGDVDGHCERARAAGAAVLTEPEDTPHGRNYRVEDLEGHRWMFSSPPPARP